MKAKRVLSLLLAVLLLVSLLPAAALADEELPSEEPAVIETAAEEPAEEPVEEEPAEEEMPAEEPVITDGAAEAPAEEPAEEPVTDGETITGTCGSGLTWTLEESGVLTIGGKGAMEDYDSVDGTPWGSDITDVVIESGVTGIGSYAFYDCTALTAVTIPESITTIGNHAFDGCTALTAVTIPGSVTSIGGSAFKGCSGLTGVTFLDSADGADGGLSIANYAFYGCSGLKAVNIESTEKWCEISFSNNTANPLCYARALYMNGEKITDLVIPDGVEKIGYCAFYNCTALTNVTIPDSVTDIGSNAFYNCTGLKGVSVGNGVTGMATNAFCRCTALTGVYITDMRSWCGICFQNAAANPLNCAHTLYLNGEAVTDVVIPAGVTGLNTYAFCNGTGIASVTIPESVTVIGVGAFNGCSGLNDVYYGGSETARSAITVYDSNTSLTNAEWHYVSVWTVSYDANGGTGAPDAQTGTAGTVLTLSSTEPTRPGYTFLGWAESGTSAAADYQAGESYTVSGDVTLYAVWDNIAWTCAGGVLTISGAGAMPDYYNGPGGYLKPWRSYSSMLYAVVIGEGITNIGGWAFEYETYLEEVTIPASVTDIGTDAFYGCSALRTVHFGGTMAQWDEIEIDDSDTVLDDAVIICSDGTIAPPVSGTCGDSLSWELNTETGLLTITGSGAMNDYTETSPWYAYRRDIYSTELAGAESIGSCAFADCVNMTGISIPATVTSIGQMAFSGCDSLAQVSIPAGVTSIAYATFECCGDLASVSLPESVTSIAEKAFFGCDSLAEIDIPAGITEIEYMAFAQSGLKTVTIPDSVTAIGSCAFSCCEDLTAVYIPAGVTEIGEYAFEGCTALTDVYYAGTGEQWEAVSVGDGSTGLQTAVIHCSDGDIREEIGGTCGDGITWTLEDGVLTLSGTGTISAEVTEVFTDYGPGGEEYTYSATCYDSPWADYAGCIRCIVINEGIEGIAANAFCNISNVVSMDIPSTMTSIGLTAFYEAWKLRTIRYNGTKEQWGEISVENDGYSFDPLEQTEIICTDGTIVPDISGTCGDNVTWRLQDGVLTISGTGVLRLDGEFNLGIDPPWLRWSRAITDIVIEEGVAGICDYAFTCSSIAITYGNVETLTLPMSFTDVGNFAVQDLETLETVYYAGTEADRENIDFGRGNSCLTDADWQYEYGTGEYTITYDANGGTGAPDAQTGTVGRSVILSGAVPARPGYAFLGWSEDSEADSADHASGAELKAGRDVTLYAVWEYSAQTLTANKSYTAVIENAGGSAYYDYTPADSRTYVLYTTGSAEAQITLYDADGVVLASGGGRLSYAMTAGETYLFGVCYTAASAMGTIPLKFGRTYTVRYSANGGIGAPALQEKDYGKALTLTTSVPARPGYSFLGWAAGKTADPAYSVGASYTANGNTTLYAVWAYNTRSLKAAGRYTAEIGNAGGTVYYRFTPADSRTYVLYITGSTAANVVIYDAAGNLLAAGAGCAEYAMTAGVTYRFGISLSDTTAAGSVALKFGRVYTIRYNANGGTGAPASQAKYYGQSIAITADEPTRSGYTFLGWATSKTATAAKYTAGDPYTANGNTTLYAVWQKNS